MEKNLTLDYDTNGTEIIFNPSSENQFEIPFKTFFNFLCDWKNDPKQGSIYVHDEESQIVTIAESSRGNSYTYEGFFKAFKKELESIFISFLESLEVAV